MWVDIVTPEGTVLSEEAAYAGVCGSEGAFGVLEGHSPLVTPLKAGSVNVTIAGAERHFLVSAGFADVTAEGVTILADEALEVGKETVSKLSAELKELKASFSGLKGSEKTAAETRISAIEAWLTELNA